MIQFSVFSNLFLLAQTNKVINSTTWENAKAGKEILLNELGVVYKGVNPGDEIKEKINLDDDYKTELSFGTIEGSKYFHDKAHFAWLCNIMKKLGLEYHEFGKRKNGTPKTLHFCDALFNLYGGEDYATSFASSFAIENWANRGFWKDLVNGLKN